MAEHQLRSWWGTLRSCARSLLDLLAKDKAVSQSGRVGIAPNMLGAVGSNPPLLTRLVLPKWPTRERIGLGECPYLHRWVADFGAFALRLHVWQASDDRRAFHDHAWWFVSIMLWGKAIDVSPAGRDVLGPGSVRFRRALHQHTFEVIRPGTVTLLITGPAVRRWGFWVNGKMQRRDKYFATNGHHPCQDGPGVRMRPDGSRIPHRYPGRT